MSTCASKTGMRESLGGYAELDHLSCNMPYSALMTSTLSPVAVLRLSRLRLSFLAVNQARMFMFRSTTRPRDWFVNSLC